MFTRILSHTMVIIYQVFGKRKGQVSNRQAGVAGVAQFIAVCRSVKMSGTCENVPPSAEQISRHQEMLSHASALAFAPPLQRRTVPNVPPYAPVERASAAMSSLPEPPHWPL